jgi:Ca2+-binding EF-hand superfamily protein
MKSLGQDPSPEELEKLIKLADGDGSGDIDFLEVRTSTTLYYSALCYSAPTQPRSCWPISHRSPASSLTRLASSFMCSHRAVVPLSLSRSQFVVLVAHKMQDDDTKAKDMDKLERAFKIFDTNNSGHIDNNELRRIMCNLGEPLKLAEVDELIKNFDEDGDGTIDIHEVSSYGSISSSPAH